MHPFSCYFSCQKLIFLKSFNIKQDEWQEMWKIALRADYAPSVDVRIIKSNDQTDPIAKVVAEAFKHPNEIQIIRGFELRQQFEEIK